MTLARTRYAPHGIHPSIEAEIGTPAILLRLARVRRQLLNHALTDLLGWSEAEAQAYLDGAGLDDLPLAKARLDHRVSEIRCQRMRAPLEMTGADCA